MSVQVFHDSIQQRASDCLKLLVSQVCERDRHTVRQTQRKRDRHRGKERHTGGDRHRDKKRQTQTERETETETETESERQRGRVSSEADDVCSVLFFLLRSQESMQYGVRPLS